MKSKQDNGVLKGFFGNQNFFPFLIGLAIGLYPLFSYFTNNFMMINSWKHVGFFVGLFILFPITLFYALNFLLKSKNNLVVRKVFLFFNILVFLLFIQICLTADIQILYSIITVLLAVVISWFLHAFLEKVVVFQFILAFLGFCWFVPVMYQYLTYSQEWMEQPDDITEAIFTKRPNIYFIQPDGYLNFSEFNKGYYNDDSHGFREYLESKDFTFYDGFRSNYNATLPSNSSIFTMRNHYNRIGFNESEVVNGRKIIISENPVLEIFKNNNYKSHYIAEWPMFLTSFPEMGYDVCNYDYNEVGYIGDGYYEQKDIFKSLDTYLDIDKDQSKFFFVHIFRPGHVAFYEKDSKGKEKEGENWFERIDEANGKLEKVIDAITVKDPSALIVIMADHGGYVGFEYMEQIHSKIEDRDLLHSAFSVIFSIKWPNNERYAEDSNFKSSVNVFRILFAYLSNNNKYLDHLQEDASYVRIKDGAEDGEYKVLDEEGNVVFEKL